MGWTIGRHRVEVSTKSLIVTVVVDDEKPLPLVQTRILGDFPIVVGKREVTIRRVRNLDVGRTELWIGGVCVPPSPDSLVQKLAPKGALCGGRHPESFRSAAAPAKYKCPGCGALLCAKCVAVDRVRCAACFEAGRREAERLLRKQRLMGPLLGAGLALSVGIGGLVFRSGEAFALGVVAALLVVFKVAEGWIKERREARRRG